MAKKDSAGERIVEGLRAAVEHARSTAQREDLFKKVRDCDASTAFAAALQAAVAKRAETIHAELQKDLEERAYDFTINCTIRSTKRIRAGQSDSADSGFVRHAIEEVARDRAKKDTGE